MSNQPIQPLNLETGTWYTAYISAVEDGPGLFSLQLDSLTKKLETVMTGINSQPLQGLVASSSRGAPASRLEDGTFCLARYSADDNIYRAVIIGKVTADRATVLYIDFGNREEVAVSQLYHLPDAFRATEALSVQCSLYQWPERLPLAVRELAKKQLDGFTDRQLNVRVMSIEEDGGGGVGACNVVQLYEDAVDIGQELR